LMYNSSLYLRRWSPWAVAAKLFICSSISLIF
jgi:hypothetical protein